MKYHEYHESTKSSFLLSGSPHTAFIWPKSNALNSADNPTQRPHESGGQREVTSFDSTRPRALPENDFQRFTEVNNDLNQAAERLMQIKKGRHASKEWFTALENYRNLSQRWHDNIRESASENRRKLLEAQQQIEDIKNLKREISEAVEASRKRTKETITRYQVRVADQAASQKRSEFDHTDDSLNTELNTDTFPDIPERSLTSPTEVPEPTQSEALRESVSETVIRNTFLDELTQWQGDINKSYLDVLIAEDLTSEEFDSFFPTEESRSQLKDRQQQMQADIARRVQGFLAEDTGNREEKLSIIRQMLSENWSPDIAEGVLERLK